MAAGSSPESDNSSSEYKNGCETDIDDPEDESMDASPPLGM